MQIQVLKWGNSMGIRLTKSMCQQLGITAGDMVEASIDDNTLKLHPIEPEPEYTLEELLAKCPKKAPPLNEEDKQWLDDRSVGKEL